MSIKIVYRDVDFQVKKDLQNTNINGNVQADYMDSQLLNFVAVPPIKQATLEKDFWKLDGSYDLFDNDEKKIALFSQSISSNIESEYGFDLSNSVSLDYVFSKVENISNITFTFDQPDYCTRILIRGFSNEGVTTKVFERNIYPDNSLYNYDFETSYNVRALRFIFYSMNKPNRFLKIYGIDFGKSYVFQDEEIYDVSILTQTSLISQQLYIGTSNIDLNIKDVSTDFFKKYKPVFIYKNDKIEQVHFISNVNQNGFNRLNLECSDVLLLLNDFSYFEKGSTGQSYSVSGSRYLSSKYGKAINDSLQNNMIGYNGPYNLDVKISDVIKDLQLGMLFKIYGDSNATDISITGYYQKKNKKDLLNEIIFANQLNLEVTKTGQIKIQSSFSNQIKEINQDRIYSNFEKRTTEKNNAISLNVYTYIKTNKIAERKEIHATELSISEENPIFFQYAATTVAAADVVIFSVDFKSDYEMEVICERIGENATVPVTAYYFTVKPTSSTETIYLEEIDSNKTVNLVTISDIAYITDDNKAKLIEALSEYYSHNSMLEFDLVLSNEKVGDLIKVMVNNKYYIGRIEKIEYTMKGKRIGNVTMRIYEEV